VATIHHVHDVWDAGRKLRHAALVFRESLERRLRRRM
jgi:hypothetical protein